MQGPEVEPATFVADLHIHSRYVFACSKALTLQNLAVWAHRKGIDLLATGDFTHPLWFDELKSGLHPSQDGLYEYDGVRFVPGTEISCVFKQSGKLRRIHLLIITPTLDSALELTHVFAKYGKLVNDGRPTLTSSARDVLEMALYCVPEAIVVPAHAWTPWYGLYGSKGGFDSLNDCFGDLSSLITAVESGLSSDPAMNHSVRELNGRNVVSFSDAHSPQKLGREMTVFRGKPSWDDLRKGLMDDGVTYTIEFYPEEGKYHHSGHRKCGISYSMEDEATQGTDCPVCGRELTLGVLNRVSVVAGGVVSTDNAPDGSGFIGSESGRPPFARLIPLQEILASTMSLGVNAKRVMREYNKLVHHFGSELAVLMRASERDLEQITDESLAEAILMARAGKVSVEPGYDGKYGVIRLATD